MVYIYKKVISGKPHYYLRVSKREGNRILSKDIAYLGSDLAMLRSELDSLSHYKSEIRRGYKTLHKFIQRNIWLEKVSQSKIKKNHYFGDLHLDVHACVLHYNNVFLKKDEKTRWEIMNQFVVEYAHNTTAVEGNTIPLEGVKKVLCDNVTPKNATLREIFDVQNSKSVFLQYETYSLTIESIVKLHTDLLANVDARIGIRTQDIRVIRSRFDPSPAPYVLTDLQILLGWYEKKKSVLHPLVLASLFHHKFEKIHPFMDGNGRTGRMLMQIILLSHNFPPINIRNKNRSFYLDCLQKADEEDLLSENVRAYQDLVSFLASELTHTYWNIFL